MLYFLDGFMLIVIINLLYSVNEKRTIVSKDCNQASKLYVYVSQDHTLCN